MNIIPKTKTNRKQKLMMNVAAPLGIILAVGLPDDLINGVNGPHGRTVVIIGIVALWLGVLVFKTISSRFSPR